MFGIDLDSPMLYIYSSFRFFKKGEHHVRRFCEDDVLLLVFEGVLRFTEQGESCEVHAGEYYVQKHNTHQSGELESDAPQYLFVHFRADWTDGPSALPRRGRFQKERLFPLMERLDEISRGKHTYTERASLFLALLTALQKPVSVRDSAANQIARYLEAAYQQVHSLDDLCREFHYSKNHIINLFKREYGMTPIDYLNEVRIRRAMYLLEVTSKPLDEIARECGFCYYSHFYRLFLRRNGTSPFAWRARAQRMPQG